MAGNTGSGAGGSERDQAEIEVQRFRVNLAAGELAHAAVHLGRALTNDPSLNSAYTCLTEFAEAAGSSASAREILKGIGIAGAPGIAAAIIALLAGEGELSSAVGLAATPRIHDSARGEEGSIRPWSQRPADRQDALSWAASLGERVVEDAASPDGVPHGRSGV